MADDGGGGGLTEVAASAARGGGGLRAGLPRRRGGGGGVGAVRRDRAAGGGGQGAGRPSGGGDPGLAEPGDALGGALRGRRPAGRRSARRWRRWRRPGAWTSCRPRPRPCVRASSRRPRPARSSPPPGIAPVSRPSWWRPPVSESLPALQQRCRAVRAQGSAAWTPTSGCGPAATCATGAMARGRFAWRPGCVPTTGPRCWPPSTSERRRVFATARRDGRREPYEAYEADALVALAERAGRRRGQERAGGHGARPGRPRRPGAGPLRGGRDVRHPRGGAHPRGQRPGVWPPTASSRCW